MKKAFIFDMDGVLIDSEPLWQQTELDLLHGYGIPITEQELARTRGMPSVPVLRYASELYQKPLDIEKVAQELLDLAISNILKAKPLMKGVTETLELLARHDIKIAIASASPRYMLDNIVQSCGIADYFSYIASGAELAYSKPHPAVYLQAAKGLGIEPAECVGIEDSKPGMISVKAASMSCIVIPNELDFHENYWALADFKLAKMYEINPQFLARL
ncbi:hexitol phosphatase HxpB [Actinobacillus genomosp. 1]|uniref:hexitol phosphatase HxpB n=1 Tax=Actinobacillus genomosp. 1 TaxID=254839 RepID=UPI002442F1E9|nr:hexitol phosphatase HxpB [Actinobacillus genomosp. 1]WGE35212.1 hexitol phosphatase HxpB [Actinobacillus genomosp. 1]